MKRLFEILRTDGKHFDPAIYAATKEAAKTMRGKDNDRKIILGPDHWRYGLKGTPRTHSHNMRSGGPGNGFKRGTK